MARISDDELINRFGYHPAASPDTAELHDYLRRVILGTAKSIVNRIPEGREASLAVTHLEEALMWANKAVALTGPVDQATGDVARVMPPS